MYDSCRRNLAPTRGSARFPARAAADVWVMIGSAKTLRWTAGCRHNAGVRVACPVTAVVIAALAGCGAELDPNQLRDAATVPGVVDAEVVDDAPADARACAGGDARVVSNGACLVVYTTPATYAGAQAACTSLSARLVVIASAQTNQAVTALIGGVDAFVGATDAVTEGTFLWSSGAALTFTNWRAGEPNNGDGGFEEDCLVVEGALGGTWDDRPCAPPPLGAGAYPYVCEY